MNEDPQQQIPIDYPSALARIGNDESFLQELLELYLMDFEAKKGAIETAIEGMNFSSIQELGHSLKGSSANLSLPFLQQASYEIETAGKDRDIGKTKEALYNLLREFQNLKNHLASKS